jgi:hypothetical protein
MRLLSYLAVIPVLLLVGCSPYVSGYYFTPHPGLSNVPATQPSQPVPAQVLATIIGIRNPDSKVNLPLSMEVRLMIENVGNQPVTFDARSMQLSTGDLVPFQPPLFNATSSAVIPPGQSAIVTANFPFPNGANYDQVDLSILHLRWLIRVGDREVQQIQEFRRAVYATYGYDPYYEPYPYYQPYPVVGGVVIVHRRW